MRPVTPSPKIDRILTGHERRALDRCWRPAGTCEWLLIHTLSGRARIVVSGCERLVGAGETILYRPGAPQDFGGEGNAPWEIVWAQFEPLPHWLQLLRWPQLVAGILHRADADSTLGKRVERLLLEADRLSSSGLPHAIPLARNALEAALLWWDLRHPTGRPLDPRVVEAIDYISRNAARRLPVDELAGAVHLSSSRFAHLFTQETGLTPRRFVERQRIERAKQLLEFTALPINKIATEVGFESQFYFATRFRRATGITPTAYRASRD
jgi:AraC family transcriptional regulator, arabinose operon regulatory protein